MEWLSIVLSPTPCLGSELSKIWNQLPFPISHLTHLQLAFQPYGWSFLPRTTGPHALFSSRQTFIQAGVPISSCLSACLPVCLFLLSYSSFPPSSESLHHSNLQKELHLPGSAVRSCVVYPPLGFLQCYPCNGKFQGKLHDPCSSTPSSTAQTWGNWAPWGPFQPWP